MIKKFYKKIFKNLNSKEIFYKYFNEVYFYSDVLKIFIIFKKFIIKYKIQKQSKICILSEKTFQHYSLIISILLSNNVWIPLTNKNPLERNLKIIKIVKPQIIFVDRKNLAFLKKFVKQKYRIKIFVIEDLISSLKKINIKNEEIQYEPIHKDNDLAMIFFTSGSVGEPKGVPISQINYLTSLYGQLTNLFDRKKKYFFADMHDTSFVISLNILLPCIYYKSAIVPMKNSSDNLYAINFLKKNKINFLITLPSFINQIQLSVFERDKKMKLDTIIMCGEPFYPAIIKTIKNKFSPNKIFNCYGSTELSPWVFYYKYSPKHNKLINLQGIVPIGKPYKFVKIYKRKSELILGGKNVVNGYLNSPNQSKFFVKRNLRYYRTGDIFIKKKNIYFIKGRRDKLIKIRGHRVELLEIESALRKNKSITNCVVFSIKKGQINNIFAALESSYFNSNRIYKWLNKILPNYMIPKDIIFYKKFYFNKNGKIDRTRIIMDSRNKINF